jgi:hypothetical protein
MKKLMWIQIQRIEIESNYCKFRFDFDYRNRIELPIIETSLVYNSVSRSMFIFNAVARTPYDNFVTLFATFNRLKENVTVKTCRTGARLEVSSQTPDIARCDAVVDSTCIVQLTVKGERKCACLVINVSNYVCCTKHYNHFNSDIHYLWPSSSAL